MGRASDNAGNLSKYADRTAVVVAINHVRTRPIAAVAEKAAIAIEFPYCPFTIFSKIASTVPAFDDDSCLHLEVSMPLLVRVAR